MNRPETLTFAFVISAIEMFRSRLNYSFVLSVIVLVFVRVSRYYTLLTVPSAAMVQVRCTQTLTLLSKLPWVGYDCAA